jgi:hypothetical protein
METKLFLSGGNLGITIGTAVGGLFISGMGTQYIVLGGLLFVLLSLVSILLRGYVYSSKATKKTCHLRYLLKILPYRVWGLPAQ